MEIDNIKLDETNKEFNYASDFVLKTDKVVYLTGKAGTGKTTFLKYLKKVSNKKTVILAPTGVAAVNAGGQTIHSFFQIKPSVYVPNDKRLRLKANSEDEDKSTIYDHFKYYKERLQLINNLELLIIDEISMVRCDLLDVIDRLFRVFRKRLNESFGGVQVILIGDTFQLPPIADTNQWSILKSHYKSPFFFSSRIIDETKPIYIELKKIYRQNEQEFINLLNKVRINELKENDLEELNKKYNPSFIPEVNENFITLATHNASVDSTNLTKIQALETELRIFEATVSGTFPDRIMPTLRSLQLKENAQIMFVKNDKGKRYYNGKIAKITSIEDENIIVELSPNENITVERQIWQNVRYKWNEETKKVEEEVLGTFNQYPLKLAWAITVHKSQGLTFENVIADLGGAFTSGQVYVALSRCTSYNGLILKSRIPRNAIKTNNEVIEFAKNETPSTLITEELNSGKIDFLYKSVKKHIDLNEAEEAYVNLGKTIKLRNDYFTKNFKRYFKYYINLIGKYKKLANSYLNLAITKDLEIDKLKSINNDQIVQFAEIKETMESTKNNLLVEVSELKKIIDKKNNSVDSLGLKIEEKNKTIDNLEAVLETEKKRIKKLKSRNDKKKKEVKMLNSNIQQIKRELENSEMENKRVKNIKWHQKLLGKE